MIAPLIAQLCAAACSAALAIGGKPPAVYDPDSTAPVYFYGVQVGVYLDDTQPNQCADVPVERARWPLVIAGNAPGPRWPADECPGALNALEYGQYWGGLPRAGAYILESSNLGPLTGPAPAMTRRALGYRPRMIIFYR